MRALLLDALTGLKSRMAPTLVTMAGLTLSLAVCLLLGLFCLALSAVDPKIPDAQRVVMLTFKGAVEQPGAWFTGSPVAFGPMLKSRQLPLALISRCSAEAMTVRMRDSTQIVSVLAADPDLVPLLGLNALHGDLRATLLRDDAIAITPDIVRKLWGELPLPDALGRSFTSRGKAYTVTAVIPPFDPRGPWFGRHDALASFSMVGKDFRGNIANEAARDAIHQINGRVFARLESGARIKQLSAWMRDAFTASPLYAQLPAEWRDHGEAIAFGGLRLDQLPFDGEDNQLRWRLLGAVGGASVLLLLLAAFNAMNLQAAVLLQRQRETALRRALGANGLHLLQLWSLEALLPLLLSGALAIQLAWWAAPAIANWLGLSPNQPVADPLPVAALLGLALTLLALLPLMLALPASMALRRAPAPALQGRTASEGPWGRRLRQGLLTLQLGGALLLLALAGVMAMQHRYLVQADRGYQTHNRLILSAMVESDMLPNLDPFIAALKQHPAVSHWAFSSARPAMDIGGPSEMHVSADRHKLGLRMTVVTPGYFDTYGMQVLAGKPQGAHGEASLVLDAKAAKALGFASPQAAIGAVLLGGGAWPEEGKEARRVVAVIGDVKQESAREAAMPQGFLIVDQPQWDLTVHGPDPQALRQALEQLWKDHGPSVPYRIWTADEQRAMVYQQEGQLTTVLATVALLAVAVAMLGAYALVADTLRRRRTELVLHRLHGAGSLAIVAQVARELLWPLLLASTIGLGLAAPLGQRYLADFVERASMPVGLALPLALAALFTVFVVTLAAWRHIRLALALQPIAALE
ncbi:FtsX-like permease family protein [Chitinimonas sp.]|uniref:FtsX-like permease family protein n=1 Tax=Chitinimonas sp. TaxID=1934313 RepID=UPI0035AD91C3